MKYCNDCKKTTYWHTVLDREPVDDEGILVGICGVGVWALVCECKKVVE